MRASRFYFFDVPFTSAITQSPLWLLWIQKASVVIKSLLLASSIILFGVLLNFDLIETKLARDLIVLSQPFLFLHYAPLTKEIGINKFYLIFIPALFLLTSGYFPGIYEMLGILNKGWSDNFRLSGLSTEPSFFAEFVLLIFYLWYLQKRKLPLLYFIIMLVLTRSTTLIQSLIIFLIVLLLAKAVNLKLEKSNILKVISVEIVLIIGVYHSKVIWMVSQFMFFVGNSWRQASNVIAIQETEFLPNPDFRTDLYNNALERGLPWMKEAAFSFLPWFSMKYGYFIFIIYFFTLIRLLRRRIGFTSRALSNEESALLIYSILHVMVLSPKYNTSLLLIIPLLFKSKNYV